MTAMTYEQLADNLRRITRQIREKRMEGFRRVIVGIRSRRKQSACDVALSEAYDRMLLLKGSGSPLVNGDIDDLLDMVNEIVDLDRVCADIDAEEEESAS
ncbi:MAG: hypothetical protein PHN51_12085 [Candidatus Nanopelagicales bacterium]|nr:hypothetical protein [Candidatus Nanopelagicales bacterium]